MFFANPVRYILVTLKALLWEGIFPFHYGEQRTSKIFLAPNMWLRSLVGSSVQPVSGELGFKPRRSLNFFQASIFTVALIAVYQ